MIKVILVSIAMLISPSAFGETVTLVKERTVKILGEVDASVLDAANKIESLSRKSKEPIHILINSPGGGVAVGSQVLSAMSIAQTRGVTIKCYVPVLAASMGFQILTNCDERYALKYSLLLFHPMRIGGMFMSLTSEDLLYHGDRLRRWEIPFIRDLLAALKIERKVFFHHYRRETLWMASEFTELSPDFLTIVDDMQGVEELFSFE